MARTGNLSKESAGEPAAITDAANVDARNDRLSMQTPCNVLAVVAQGRNAFPVKSSNGFTPSLLRARLLDSEGDPRPVRNSSMRLVSATALQSPTYPEILRGCSMNPLPC